MDRMFPSRSCYSVFLAPDLTFNNSRNFGNNDEDDFRVVSGILRLSTKYLVDSLRAKAITHLSIAWPSNLKAWDLRDDFSRSFENEGGSRGSAHRYPHPYVCSCFSWNEPDHTY
jgi:hypothetical protein